MTHFIDNLWINSTTENTLFSINPATGKSLFKGSNAGKKEVDLAVNGATDAFAKWTLSSIDTRISYLKAFQQELKENQVHIATTISKETGKPLWDSLTEVSSMISKIDISVLAYYERTSEKKDASHTMPLVVKHRPHGLVAVFGPFNFPGHIPLGHIIPALLAGNCVIFKPSEKTPLTSIEIIKLWQKINPPKGVLNLVQGDAITGKLIASHPALNGLFFTGSLKTGLALNQLFASTPEKILALEMGGNNPLIVWEASNLSSTIYQILLSAFITTGQRCTCARRLIVPEGNNGHAILNHLEKAIQNIVIGSYDDTIEPFMGPLISNEALNNLLHAERTLLSLGATSLIPLKRLDPKLPFLSPGLIDVTSIKDLPDEEYFGPLLQVIRANSFEEAISLSANTKYGLVTSLLSDNKLLYEQFYIHSKAGLIHWNAPTTGASSKAPFGGIGRSGNFRPGAYYATDFCSYPVASFEVEVINPPSTLLPGIKYV
ncbi:MAG: succinylglutamate-semialdehyde dehydrogenase [Chlamydiales bacterium]|nr:succinylglutamate-semialdehyde dehydrogenase [Chlamydiales bacterium]